jgi:hypothetical protein
VDDIGRADPLTGVKPRITDRLRMVWRVLGVPTTLILRGVRVAIVITALLAWQTSLPDAALALVAVALLAVLLWATRLSWWLSGHLWEQELLDLPRRHRRIPGPRPGTWATDVVPADGRYAVLLLHYGREGRPHPADALDAPYEPWGGDANVRSSRTRTVVAFEWADDAAAAQDVVARFTRDAAARD